MVPLRVLVRQWGGRCQMPPKNSSVHPQAFLTSSSFSALRVCVSVCVTARVTGRWAGRGHPSAGWGGIGGVSYLPVLLQVVVEDLGVGLLMRGEDVHEGGGGIRRRRGRVDGPPAAQRRRQVEGGRRGSSVKSLLLEGLLRGDTGVRARTGRCSPAPLHKRVPQRTTDSLC